MEQIGGEMNELLNTKMCSPMMIYLAVLVTSALSVFITRNHLKRHNTTKMDNLFNLYSLHELKFMIVFGLILFGLCQYNKTTLAWVFLLFPVIYVVIQNLIVHVHVSSAIQTSPKEVEVQQMPQYGAQVMPQDTHQSEPPMVPAMKQSVDMPVNTRSSQVLGGSGDFGGVSSGGGNFAYF
tara:strand:- start:376 stop:915 length:540 start_codon:yes stop_codon:yes gene_type:complete